MEIKKKIINTLPENLLPGDAIYIDIDGSPKKVKSWDTDPIEVLKWVLSLIDEPGNTEGDVKQMINEKIFTFTEKKDAGTKGK